MYKNNKHIYLFQMDYLAGSIQVNCPYWHMPLPSPASTWINGTKWKVLCSHPHAQEYITAVLESLGAELSAGEDSGNIYRLDDEHDSRPDAHYFNVEGFLQLVSYMAANAHFDLGQSKEDTKFDGGIHEDQAIGNSNAKLSDPADYLANKTLMNFQFFVRKRLQNFGFIQGPLFMSCGDGFEEICSQNLKSVGSGYLYFGRYSFMCGAYRSRDSLNSAAFAKTLCGEKT